jgi:endonuclease/exonuclease/phosphatase family metal-dependent hydrolase
MRAIGRALAGLDVDVVGLQEVFTQKDRQVIDQGAERAGLVHTHYFSSGVMGSGLLTLSRYPIEDVGFLRFRLNGRPLDPIRVDYYAGKGIGRVRLCTPAGPVDVYNAHLIAPYLEFGPDRFYAHRLAQALEAGRYMQTESGQVPALLTCDLNCLPDSLAYRTLIAVAELVETYRAANPDHATITVADKIPYARLHPPERLDYIFARSGAQGSFTVARSALALTTAPEPNPDHIPGFSDHYGVRSELELTATPPAAIDEAAGDPALKTSLARALGHGIRHEKVHRRNAGIFAAAASLASATLLSPGRGRPRGRGIVRVLAGVAVTALLLTGGLNLSTLARLDTEMNTLRGMMAEEI